MKPARGTASIGPPLILGKQSETEPAIGSLSALWLFPSGRRALRWPKVPGPQKAKGRRSGQNGGSARRYGLPDNGHSLRTRTLERHQVALRAPQLIDSKFVGGNWVRLVFLFVRRARWRSPGSPHPEDSAVCQVSRWATNKRPRIRQTRPGSATRWICNQPVAWTSTGPRPSHTGETIGTETRLQIQEGGIDTYSAGAKAGNCNSFAPQAPLARSPDKPINRRPARPSTPPPAPDQPAYRH